MEEYISLFPIYLFPIPYPLSHIRVNRSGLYISPFHPACAACDYQHKESYTLAIVLEASAIVVSSLKLLPLVLLLPCNRALQQLQVTSFSPMHDFSCLSFVKICNPFNMFGIVKNSVCYNA